MAGRPPRVLASTTSHKREALAPTLEVFARLGLADIDLNLHHLIEGGVHADEVAASLAVLGLRVWVVSGGWCDFFHQPPEIDRTFSSVQRQVAMATTLGARMLRLFFGRLAYADYSPMARDRAIGHLVRLSEAHPGMTFVFENHDGASLHASVCRELLQGASRPNIRMNFDPVNFAKAGVDPLGALGAVGPFVAHVHLKGLKAGEYCEFGDGDVDLDPALTALTAQGYSGQFTVEYEGRGDGTLRLWRSVQLARSVLGD